MKANIFVRKIFLTEYVDKGRTVDRILFGRPEKEVRKVATCMVITPVVLQEAVAWGADLIVTHEPTFLTDKEDVQGYPPYEFKREMLEREDITVCRWHDSPHYGNVDYVSNALIKRMNWKGSFDGKFEFVFDEPITPLQIAKDIREKLGINQPRIVGRRDGEVKKMSIQLGMRGSDPYLGMLKNDVDLALCGENCEWHDCEPIRDMAQIGMQKSIIILGHAGSERGVMDDLASYINSSFEEYGIEARYFDCGELYSYID